MKSALAYTLIELLVVLAILGILMALLLPAVQKVRAVRLLSYSAKDILPALATRVGGEVVTID